MRSLPSQLRHRARKFRLEIAAGFWPDTPAFRRVAEILVEEAREAQELRDERVRKVNEARAGRTTPDHRPGQEV